MYSLDLIPTVLAACGHLLYLPTAQAGWRNIPNLSQRDIFTILMGHPVPACPPAAADHHHHDHLTIDRSVVRPNQNTSSFLPCRAINFSQSSNEVSSPEQKPGGQ